MADSEQIGFRCPKNIAIAFQQRLKEIGQEKTKYLVALLAKDLGVDMPISLSDRVEDLEKRVQSIEARLDAD